MRLLPFRWTTTNVSNANEVRNTTSGNGPNRTNTIGFTTRNMKNTSATPSPDRMPTRQVRPRILSNAIEMAKAAAAPISPSPTRSPTSDYPEAEKRIKRHQGHGWELK